MTRKTCVITGANSGIGFWTTTFLAEKGFNIIMLCRSAEKGELAKSKIMERRQNEHLKVIQAELSSFASIAEAAKNICSLFSSIDVLINNAGMVSSDHRLNNRGIELTFAVNHLAPFYLTHLLLKPLSNSDDGRIITVSSNIHKKGKIYIDDLNLHSNYKILRAYNQSKLANVQFTYVLEEKLAVLNNHQISTYCVDPGHVNTGIGLKNVSKFHGLAWFLRSKMGVNAKEGATCQTHLASANISDLASGKFWKNSRIINSSPASYDKKTAHRLWKKSEELCGIDDYFIDLM